MGFTFYHATRANNAKDAVTDFAGGAKSTGVGQGGQRNGFYVFTSHKAAAHHATDFLSESGKPLPVIVSVDVNDLKNWDIDCEQNAPAVLRLMGQHRHLIAQCAGQDFTYPISSDGKTEKFSVLQLNDRANTFSYQRGAMRGAMGFNREDDDLPSLQGVGIIQSLSDHFCATDPAYKKDYDKLLADIAGKPGRAIKYTGAEPLPIAGMQQFNGAEWTKITMAPHPAQILQHLARAGNS